MKRFLKRIKLIQHLTTELNVQKNAFIVAFRQHVDEGNTSSWSSLDFLTSSKNVYKGQVGFDGFKIKRRAQLFDANTNFAVAKGTYRQIGQNLVINTEIYGVSRWMIFYYIIILLFYSVFIVLIFYVEDSDFKFTLPIILVHASFMFGLSYFLMRKSISRMKHDLERELYYVTKNISSSPKSD